MKTIARILRLVVVLVLLVVSALSVGPRHLSSTPSANNVVAREMRLTRGLEARPHHLRALSSGVRYAALQAAGDLTRRAAQAPAQGLSVTADLLLPPSGPATVGCAKTLDTTNVRVNQDCTRRRQAEEVIAINPTNAMNLVAGQNDSRLGFNHCGFDWSFDGGRTWGDLVPPFYEFVMGDGHTADACSDPSATFDRDGNAYISGILFDISTPVSAIVVAKSRKNIGGRFFHSPAASPFQLYETLPLGIVVNDNDAAIFNDKQFIVADASKSSPKVGNVYAAWTRFRSATGVGVDADSPIFFSQSTDGGATWSAGIEISGANSAICTVGSGETDMDACDQDQGPHPIVGMDGAVYVTFSNSNTPDVGLNQFAIVSCPPSADCSQMANWSTPVKIADDFALQPIGPDPVTGCEADSQCLPPNGYRVNDDTSGSLSIDRMGNLYFAWADFRHGGGSCTPLGDAASVSGPCNNDVFYAFSTDGGGTWSPAINVTPSSRFGHSAQWQPWSSISPGGGKLWVAYYDRSYGLCEQTGCNDITLAKVQNPASATRALSYTRLTAESMPNLTPANNPIEAGFLGDYMWVTVDKHGRPYVVWSDTRGRNNTVEEDVYFHLPTG
ncbi:MAG: exo-alpha-sialidase [Deltaproteobacteria bacterium]|nr:exo-alpha-sialidase [Deltaproteobacteria bacterium]MBI3387382.1 exo-alpha-sialidase [Deltaproteobacteria bacterium]